MKALYQRVMDEISLRELLNPLKYSVAGYPGLPILVQASAFDALKSEYLRLSAELKDIKLALGNFEGLLATKIIQGEYNASSEGEVESSDLGKHQDRNEGRETTEASYSHCGIRSGKQPTEEISTVQESPGTLIQELNEARSGWSENQNRFVPAPHNFRTDDVMLVEDLGLNTKPIKYKWDPKFDYSKGPYLPPDDDQTNKDRFFAGNFTVGSC